MRVVGLIMKLLALHLPRTTSMQPECPCPNATTVGLPNQITATVDPLVVANLHPNHPRPNAIPLLATQINSTPQGPNPPTHGHSSTIYVTNPPTNESSHINHEPNQSSHAYSPLTPTSNRPPPIPKPPPKGSNLPYSDPIIPNQ